MLPGHLPFERSQLTEANGQHFRKRLNDAYWNHWSRPHGAISRMVGHTSRARSDAK